MVGGDPSAQLGKKEKKQREEKGRSENTQPCLISSVTGLTVVYITENKQTTSKANGPLYGRTPNTPAIGVGAGSNLDALMGLDGTTLLMLEQASQYRLSLLAAKC